MTARYLLQAIGNGRALNPPNPGLRSGLPAEILGKNFALAMGAGDLALAHEDEVAVVGKLFAKVDNRLLKDLDPPEWNEVMRTKGHWLIENCWGGYVAVISGHDDESLSVIRDPSGMLGCYHVHAADGTIAFSNEPELLCRAGFATGRVDWLALTQHLRSADFRGAATCLEEIGELFPGCRMMIGKGEATGPAWSPWDHIEPDWRLGRESAPELVSRTIDNCVRAWAKSYGRIIMGISGGLDSSIVLSALKTACVAPDLYTLATAQPEGDEREYARVVARHCGYDVAERPFDISAVDPALCHVAHLPRPTGSYFVQAVEAAVRSQIAGSDCDADCAIFSGGGGDNIFCYAHSAMPLVDRWLQEGLGAGVFATARDIYGVTGATLPAIFAKAISRRWAKDRRYRWRISDMFIADRAIEAGPPLFEHPWLDGPVDSPPGKAMHIALLLRFQNHLERHRRPDFPPTIMPLLSQPIVELCLSIPTWRWYEGGVNRSVARQAYAQKLPEPIIRRTSKGRPDGFALEIFDTYREALREMLLDGLLRRHGILDDRAIDLAMASGSPTHIQQLRLLELGNAEAWARKWEQ
jgi:asparagine synthase (glutamine-hydrolysing)